MKFNIKKDAKEKTKYLKLFNDQYVGYKLGVIDTSQTIKHFVNLKESDIVKNKKDKAKNIPKFTNVSFMIKIVLHQASERAKSSQIIDYLDIKAKKHRYVVICKIIFETLKNWSINIFFEIKLHEYISRSEMLDAQHLHYVHKIWTFRIDHKCDLLKFIMFQFDQLYDSNNFKTHEQFFYKYCDINEHV